VEALGGQTASVTRFQPLRVLLAGRDRRYIRVTSFLLERRGYTVRSTTVDDVAEAAKRHRSDVVLLEGDRVRTEGARRAAAVAALNPTARVILVVDTPAPAWTGMSTLPKWIELDTLVDEIEALPHRGNGNGDGANGAA
jgi:CheY-like chemotaxis protein